MGELASGIAHELNQPLSAILSYAEASSLAVRAGKLHPEQILKDLECISSAADRGGMIVNRLRSLVANRSIGRSRQDINKLIAEAISLLAHDIERLHIKMRMELAHSLPPVLADPIQIQQVVVNLVRNAIEAMENSDAKQLVIRSSLHGSKEVGVSICDSGCGLGAISTETIFGHFYTTKPDGLGVGLAISQSIVEAHGGDLTAERNAERGMTFGFRLPRIALDHNEEI
jgi:C4-dicarboxylate-specific signal transduction histidine kinase